LTADVTGGARLLVHRMVEVCNALSRQARASSRAREAVTQ
jgi:hypothetical protein